MEVEEVAGGADIGDAVVYAIDWSISFKIMEMAIDAKVDFVLLKDFSHFGIANYGADGWIVNHGNACVCRRI